MRFGILGAGVIGALRAQALRRVPGGALVAVADVDEARAARVAGRSARAFADFRALLDRSEVEAVVVATPAPLHEEQVLAALAAGKHVLCEKPLAPSVEACRRMVQAAGDRVLATGFDYRYFPPFQWLRDVLAAGRLGAVGHLTAFAGHDGLRNFRAEWMYRGELAGGGAMMDIGLHLTDLVRFLAGEIRTVQGRASGDVWRVAGSEDDAWALFDTERGATVAYHATWNEWRGFRFGVEARGGEGLATASYAPMRTRLVARNGRRSVRRYPWVAVREKLFGWQTTTRRAFAAELADLGRRARGEEVPLASGLDGQRAVEVAHALYRSSRERRPVELR